MLTAVRDTVMRQQLGTVINKKTYGEDGMKYGRSRYLFIVFGLFAGCAGAPQPIDKQASPEKIANDTGLANEIAGAIVRCNMADTAPGEKLAIFRPCLYVPLSDGAALVGYEEAQL